MRVSRFRRVEAVCDLDPAARERAAARYAPRYDTDDYRRLLAFLARKPGVRFCLRDFLTQRSPPPPEQAGAIRFLTGLQEQLARDDTSFGYTFLIGTTE